MIFDKQIESRLSAVLPQKYVEMLLKRDPLPPLLCREIWNQELGNQLGQLTVERVSGTLKVDENQAGSIVCALLLLNDDLKSSHVISQNIYTSSGSYLHGIIHRREGDFSNARFWFNRVNHHSAFPAIVARLKEARISSPSAELSRFLEQNEWSPFDFVDWCERASLPEFHDGENLQKIQWLEMLTMLEACL